MHKIKSAPTALFDVDDTLIMWNPSLQEIEDCKLRSVKITCNGITESYYVNHHNVEFLQNLAKRGYAIVVWSASGVNWCESVVESLFLQDYVDVILSKPVMYVDDVKDPTEWIGKYQYIDLNGRPAKSYPHQGAVDGS